LTFLAAELLQFPRHRVQASNIFTHRVAGNDDQEEDGAARESEEHSLSNLLPILSDVLLTQNAQADVDIDEEAAKEAANNTDDNRSR